MEPDVKGQKEALGDDFAFFLAARDFRNCRVIVDNLWELGMFPEAISFLKLVVASEKRV